MFYFVGIILMRGICGCEKDLYNSNTILYIDGEMLNLTVQEGAYPDDIEVTKYAGSCSSLMRLPDEYFDDTFRKFDHLKQIRVPMTSAMHECAYDMTMRTRSACLVKRITRFEMRPSRGAPAQSCQVGVALRWREELHARFTAETLFVCAVELALCEELHDVVRSDIVFDSELIIGSFGSNNPQKIKINLREGDFAQNVSTFVCRAVSRCLHANLTVAGRLVADRSGAALVAVPYRVGDEYNATCSGLHGHWVTETGAQTSVENNPFTKKLEKEDDGMKLICVDITCEEFESNQTCYKKILKEIRFRLKASQGYGVIVGAVGASLVLVSAVTCVVCARRRRAPLTVGRRPRMPTPPPERPPRRQPYYSVPFERPIPGPRRD